MSDNDPDTADGALKRGDGPHAGRPDDEPGVARVLRAAGGRALPSDDMKQTVRAAVHAEWRAAVAKRNQRRVWMAIAASVVVAALALWVSRPYFGEHEVVASASLTTGSVQSRSWPWGTWRAVTAATPSPANTDLRAGTDLMTGRDGRVALELRDGVSLRLDHDTRIAFVDASRIDVKSGAVYVDAGTAPSASEHLRVGTPAGIVQHVGTQYEARIVNGGTRIRVREGRVDLQPERGNAQSAGVGEQLLVTPSGEIQRGAIAPNDPQWEWAANTAPAFDINGRPVRDFIEWVGRELGRDIVFANPESEAEANRAVLSGSVAGLAPAEALPAVLATTQLRGAVHEATIEIARQSSP
jgi:ferric-dicitrate binding protein FerR (iron transport regulator)